MKRVTDAINAYIPRCEQEARDKAAMLAFLARNENALLRENETAHLTASAWAVNRARSHVLMVYHNIYRSWSWTGGHADGDGDLLAVALRELREETGIKSALPVSSEVFSLEILTVDGHEKRGVYVPSHLHLNLTYLLEADDREPLSVKPDENRGVRWIPSSEVLSAVTEPWMNARIYEKLLLRARRI